MCDNCASELTGRNCPESEEELGRLEADGGSFEPDQEFDARSCPGFECELRLTV